LFIEGTVDPLEENEMEMMEDVEKEEQNLQKHAKERLTEVQRKRGQKKLKLLVLGEREGQWEDASPPAAPPLGIFRRTLPWGSQSYPSQDGAMQK
jgi:hypothetical protein